jgi:hypothetical protein
VSKLERQKRYRTTGAAAKLVKVETLVPPEGRDEILKLAARLRKRARRKTAPLSKLDAQEIVRRISELNALQPRRYAAQPNVDTLVATSVNVPFPIRIKAEKLAETLRSEEIPIQYRPHLERFLGETPQALLLRFCDRHGISADKLRSFVGKHRSLLGLHRPALDEHLDALVPNP